MAEQQDTGPVRVEYFEAIVIGTGFGGAVAACRLAEAGVNVCVLERGRRYGKSDFPRSTAKGEDIPDLARWSWSIDQGLWEMRDLRGLHVAQAAGYGGGSLIYANVHLRAPDEIFADWPAPFNDPRRLDPYYDLAATMLDVKPINSPKGGAGVIPAKTMLMKAAAASDTVGRKDEFFYPPLAVNFDKTGPNEYGRNQSACTMCGECDIGCGELAKNTLDLNYLARVEDAPNATVRTLAEVFRIGDVEEGAGFSSADNPIEVHYYDHLQGGRRRVLVADAVFVCAGAVNSTDLLLKARQSGSLVRLTRQDAELAAARDKGKLPIGELFFANSDAVGMVYDTRDVHQPAENRGPVITTSIVYRRPVLEDNPLPDVMQEGAAHHVWFLLQEGSYPESMKWAFRLFRGRALFALNRATTTQHAVDDGYDVLIQQVMEEWPDIQKAAVIFAQTAHLPTLGTDVAQAEMIGRARKRKQAKTTPEVPDEESWTPTFVPKDIEEVWTHIWTGLRAAGRSEVGAVAEAAMKRTLESHIDAYTPRNALLRWLVRPIVAGFSRFVAGRIKPELLVSDTERAILHRYIGVHPELEQLVWTAVRRLLFHSAPTPNTAMLLVMGRDGASGSLRRHPTGALRVEWSTQANYPVIAAQERVMRDYATALGGELRLNPLWTGLRRPVTVHAQGGCVMGPEPEKGVVDAKTGAVFGVDNLYIMDASIIPRSVGVNPSATIAAVAEHNIEAVLRSRYGRRGWRSKDHARVQKVAPHRRAEWLAIPGVTKTRAPEAGPIGITFKETLRGHHMAFRETLDYATAYDRGREVGQIVNVELDVTINDVEGFLLDDRHTAALGGTAEIQWPGPGGPRNYDLSGSMEFFVPPDESLDSPGGMQSIQYHMDLTAKAPGGDELLALEAAKYIYDDPGFDSWTDTTTLVFRVFTRKDPSEQQQPLPAFAAAPVAPAVPTSMDDEKALTTGEAVLAQKNAQAALPNELSRGILRVHFGDFIRHELPSFHVFGTTDPTQKGWALARFSEFFFKHLYQVFAPKFVEGWSDAGGFGPPPPQTPPPIPDMAPFEESFNTVPAGDPTAQGVQGPSSMQNVVPPWIRKRGKKKY